MMISIIKNYFLKYCYLKEKNTLKKFKTFKIQNFKTYNFNKIFLKQKFKNKLQKIMKNISM